MNAVENTAMLPGARRLQPSRGLRMPHLDDVWRYRGLLYFLIWRDIKVRYKQTALGAAWALVQPLMGMIVFTIFFGRLAKMPSDGLPYPVFSLAALVPWTYFSAALGAGSVSLAGYQHIISKVYFPRVLVPLAAVLVPVIDFLIAFVMLAGLMAWYHLLPGVTVLWLPAFTALAVATAAAASLWLSALNVRYRDVKYMMPFAIQLWMFATPVAYPASLVPERWRAWYGLNPMAGVIEGFRWVLLGGPSPGPMTVVSALVVTVALLTGAVYFRSVEGTFADVI